MRKQKFIKPFGVLVLGVFMTGNSMGQVYSNMEVGAKNKALADSLKASEYPYILPIWETKQPNADSAFHTRPAWVLIIYGRSRIWLLRI